MFKEMLICAVALLFKVLAVSSLRSYNVSDLCSPTLSPNITLTPETTLITFTPSLVLSQQCDINVTWGDWDIVKMSSDPYNLTTLTLPCDWISAAWNLPAGGTSTPWYICAKRGHTIAWHITKGIRGITIGVKSTLGRGERIGDLDIVLTPQYDTCTGDMEQNTTTYNCCKHGENETAEDYVECPSTTSGFTGGFTCLHKRMVCDGVVNCYKGVDEECTTMATSVSTSTSVNGCGWLVMWVWVGCGWLVM